MTVVLSLLDGLVHWIYHILKLFKLVEESLLLLVLINRMVRHSISDHVCNVFFRNALIVRVCKSCHSLEHVTEQDGCGVWSSGSQIVMVPERDLECFLASIHALRLSEATLTMHMIDLPIVNFQTEGWHASQICHGHWLTKTISIFYAVKFGSLADQFFLDHALLELAKCHVVLEGDRRTLDGKAELGRPRILVIIYNEHIGKVWELLVRSAI